MVHNVLICALIAVASLFATPAVACCIYNHTSAKMSVDIPITLWRSNIHVDPGDHECTDGTGGKAQVSKVVAWANDKFICSVHVDNHGHISIYEEGDRYKVVSKHRDNSVAAVCYGKK